MFLKSMRTVEPLNITFDGQLETIDIEVAFEDPADTALFFSIFFSPAWETSPMSDQLEMLSKVARLAENKAVDLGLTGSVEPKE